MTKLRILLADDHALVRSGLKLMLNAQADMVVVGEAGDGKEAFARALELQPDVVVMDISMPGVGGAQATERLRRSCPAVKVLALSAHEDEAYLRQLLRNGACGYVLKRAVADELTHAIRRVAAGDTYIDPTLAGKLVEAYAGKPCSDSRRGADLSDRETEVLRLVAWGFSNKEIAARLHVSVKTVETYKARLMEKLKLRSRTDIVRYALQQGWLQEA